MSLNRIAASTCVPAQRLQGDLDDQFRLRSRPRACPCPTGRSGTRAANGRPAACTRPACKAPACACRPAGRAIRPQAGVTSGIVSQGRCASDCRESPPEHTSIRDTPPEIPRPAAKHANIVIGPGPCGDAWAGSARAQCVPRGEEVAGDGPDDPLLPRMRPGPAVRPAARRPGRLPGRPSTATARSGRARGAARRCSSASPAGRSGGLARPARPGGVRRTAAATYARLMRPAGQEGQSARATGQRQRRCRLSLPRSPTCYAGRDAQRPLRPAGEPSRTCPRPEARSATRPRSRPPSGAGRG